MAAGKPAPKVFRFGVLELDLRAGELRKHGVRVKLQEQPFQVLSVLLEHAGEVVTKDELRQRIWPSDTFVDFDHGLHSAITRLREALGDSSETPRFIETLPRRGYRFIAPVQEIGQPVEPSSKVASQQIPPRGTERARRFAASVLAGLLGGALLLGAFVGFDIGGARRWLHRHSNPPVRALAVLPLQNVSGDPAQEYFADGMTDALVTNLAQMGDLRVISRTSAMQYKSTRKALPQIARELGVDAVLEGSVLRSGNRVRITAQLVDAATDQHLWAGSYERDVGDVVLLQGEMSRAIADEIRLKLSPQQRSRLERARLADPEVYELCLLGRYQWNKRTEVGLRKAIEYFQQASERDPGYAPAYAGLAEAYAVLPYYSRVPLAEAFPKARAAAQRAVALDERLPEAHTTLGLIGFTFYLDWSGAEREFKKALELNSNDATAHHWYAFYLWQTNGLPDALAEMERARQLDPLSLIINADEGTFFYAAHRSEESIVLLKKAIDLDPNFAQAHRTLALVLVQKRQFAESISEADAALALGKDDPNTMAMVGYVYAVAGRNEHAQKLLTSLQARAKAGTIPSLYPAMIYIGLGRSKKALDLLEETYGSQSRGLLFYMTLLPLFDGLGPEPRYQSLLLRMRESQHEKHAADQGW